MGNTYTRMCDICKQPIGEHTKEMEDRCREISKMSYWRKDE